MAFEENKDGSNLTKTLLIHPFLFSTFPIVFLFSRGIGYVSFSFFIIPLVAVICCTMMLLLVTYVFVRDSNKAGLIVSIFSLLFFSYGHVLLAMQKRGIFTSQTSWEVFLLIIWLSILVCSTYLILRTRSRLFNLSRILNVIAATLILFSLTTMTARLYKIRSKIKITRSQILGTNDVVIKTSNSIPKNLLPDIYYIIPDRYANARTLKKVYNFDNSEFLEYLSDKGFYVVSPGNANYHRTPPSIASSLNMKYIGFLTEIYGEQSFNSLPIMEMIKDNGVLRFLKANGYKYVHLGAFFVTGLKNEFADINIGSGRMNEFLSVLSKTTMLKALNLKSGLFDNNKSMWNSINYQLNELAQVSEIDGPVFVFAHLIVPHPPYVFGKNGEFVSEEHNEKIDVKTQYINQLIFVNNALKTLIEKILADSNGNAVIILQSDEGPFPPGYDDGPLYLSFKTENANDQELKTKLGILNAYYIPKADKSVFYPSITPVNTFRLIFNIYFNADLNLLPDESYVFPGYGELYKFLNVTDRVK